MTDFSAVPPNAQMIPTDFSGGGLFEPPTESADQIRATQQKEDEDRSFLAALRVSMQQNPDTAAAAHKIARKLGRPIENAGHDMDVAKALYEEQAAKVARYREMAPRLTHYMRDQPWFANSAHDDLENLAQQETFAHGVARGWNLGFQQNEYGYLGVRDAMGWLTPEEKDRLAELEILLGQPTPKGFTAQGAMLFGQQIDLGGKAAAAGAAAAIPVGAVSGPASPLTAGGTFSAVMTGAWAVQGALIEGGTAYRQFIKQGMSPARAKELAFGLYAPAAGVLEAYAGKFFAAPFRGAATKLGARILGTEFAPRTVGKAFRDLVVAHAKELIAESVTEGAQNVAQDVIGNVGLSQEGLPTKGAGAITKDALDVMLQTAQGMVLAGLPGPMMEFAAGLHHAEVANQRQQAFLDLVEQRAKSKSVERDPEGNARFLQDAMGQGASHVYLEASKVLEALDGKDAALAAFAKMAPEAAESLRETAAQGGDVAIPMAQFLEITRSDLYPALQPHQRLAADEPSLSEIQEAKPLAERMVKQLRERIDGTLKWTAEAVELEAEFLKQVSTAQKEGNLDIAPEQRRDAAAVARAFMEVLARQAGLTPKELAERMPLKAVFEPAAATGSQVLNADTSSDAFRAWFGDSKVVDEGGKPLVVYHGTGTPGFAEFSKRFAAKDAALGKGFYFTSDPDRAGQYAGPRGAVMPVFLTIKNPASVKDVNDAKGNVATLKRRGFDGIAFQRSFGPGMDYVVFEPTQIKSATGNRGTFDPNDPNILRQDAESDAQWADWEPPTTSDGKIKGAPEWVQSRADVVKMRKLLRKLTSEGAIGRYWYENTARAVLRITNGDPLESEKFIQLLAIYSPKTNIWTNLIMAVRAYTHWKMGRPSEQLRSATSAQDAKAVDVLYNNKDWDGRKTNSFYANLLHELVQRFPEQLQAKAHDMPATIDLWMFRAFGYENEQGGDDKGAGRYSFAENSVRRLTAELNANLQPGEARWLPHQVQAAIWTAMKSRYEIQEVKDQTNRKSRREGLIYEEDGTTVYGRTAEERRQHLNNWHHFAMQVTSAEAEAAAKAGARGFADDIETMTETVTWEAIPSAALGHTINDAPPEVRAAFTMEARALLLGPNGEDLLAGMLGVPLAFSETSEGAYAGGINPNVLSHLLPMRTKGSSGFSVDEVRAYARAIQFIFKHDAVPWFRAESRPITSAAAREAQLFRVVSPKGKTVSGGKFETQAEAEAFAKSKGEGFAVRGGDLARAVAIRFGADLDAKAEMAILTGLQGVLGPDAGYTRVGSREILVVNFRDDSTKVPFARTDEEFLEALQSFGSEHEDALGISEAISIWTEGEYGPTHDWRTDPEGEAIRDQGGLGGRPDLQAWLRDRRAAFDRLLEAYRDKEVVRRAAAAAARFRDERLNADNIGRRLPPRATFDPAKLLIALHESADITSAIHELGHGFLEMSMRVLTAQIATPDKLGSKQLAEDVETLFDWFGHMPEARLADRVAGWNALGTDGQRAMHEQFAYRFEEWMFGGDAPTKKLEGVFKRLLRWAGQLLRSVKDRVESIFQDKFGRALPEATPEVKAVFGRMLAAQEDIERQDAVEALVPVFKTKEEFVASGRTEADWEALQAALDDAKVDAVADLTRSSLRQMKWLEGARSRVLRELQREARGERAEIRAAIMPDVAAQPVYRARRWFRTGRFIEGTGGDEQGEIDPNHYLSRSAVQAMNLGGADTEELGSILRDDGQNPDVIAEAFGYTSGEALVRDLLAAPSLADAVREAVDRRMLDEHAEWVPGTPEHQQAIEQALHNEARMRFVATELKFLDKATRPVRVMTAAAKLVAEEIVGKTRLSEMQPRTFSAAARRAAREASVAMKEGRFDDAIDAKRQELLQSQLVKAAIEARDEVAKGRKFARLFARKDKQLAKSRDVNLVGAARAVLAAFGMAEGPTDAAPHLERVAEYDPVLYSELAPIVARATSGARPYRELTFDQFRDVIDAVKALWWHAKRQRDILVNGQRVSREEAKAQILAQLAKKGVSEVPPDEEPGSRQRLTKAQKTKRGFGTIKAGLRHVESWCIEQDGGKPNGPLFTYVFLPIRQKFDDYMAEKGQRVQAFHDSIYRLGIENRKIDAPTLRYTFANKGELLGAILHMGNDSNAQNAVARGWARRDIDGAIDATAFWQFVQEQLDAGVLTRADMDFVQGVWDGYEEVLPRAQRAHFENYGYYAGKIEARGFSLRIGGEDVAFRGGYVPAKGDPDLNAARPNQSGDGITEVARDFAETRPSTGKGFLISRKQIERKLAMDLRMHEIAMDEELRFIHLQRVGRDVSALLNDKGITEALRQLDPSVRTELLFPWLNDTMQNRIQQPGLSRPLTKVLQVLRRNTGAAMMFANLRNAVQQVTGLGSSLVHVKARYLRAASARFLSERGMTDRIVEQSEFMRLRLRSKVGQIVDDIDVLTDPTWLGKAQDWVHRHAYFLQGWMQNPVDVITWAGAYDQALAEGYSTDAAVTYADSIVRRSQASGTAADISKFERGSPLVRVITQFSTFWIASLNSVLAQPTLPKRLQAAAMLIVFAGVAASAVTKGLEGGWDDEDDDGQTWDDVTRWAFGEALQSGAAMGAPVIGPAVMRMLSSPSGGRLSFGATTSALEQAARVIIDAQRLAVDPASIKGRDVRDIGMLFSLLTGLPISSVAKPLAYVTDVEQGKVEPSGTADFVRGLLAGR